MSNTLEERLLEIMDKKDHWAWPRFERPGLEKAQLLVHFRHEYQVYVRDFPVLLARVLGQSPPDDVRSALAENIYEEQTGRLSVGVSHPQLFLDMMDGLGFSEEELAAEDPPLESEARKYRSFLDAASANAPWQVAAAVMTIFVEGSRHERAEMEGTRQRPPIEEAVANHPLVAHYGCPPEKMRLARAHAEVEGGHRKDAWKMVLDHVPVGSDLSEEVVRAVGEALELWLSYRDGVARAMGLNHD